MRLEPGFGAVRLRARAAQEAPEFRRMVEVDEMGDLVRREIVEHERRREDQAPGEAERAGRRARAPAAHRVAHRDSLRLDPDAPRVPRDRGLDVLMRLALQEISDATRHVRAFARDADERLILALLEPDDAAGGR